MQARLSKNRTQFVASLVFIGVALWLARHIASAVEVGSIPGYLYTQWVYIFSFIVLMLTMWFSYREEPHQDSTVNQDNVAVVVPAYNEDPEALRDCLRSLVEQTRRPQTIYLIDDGSDQSQYVDVKEWFIAFAERHSIQVCWKRQVNGGKRHAQANAFYEATAATIFITVDSDSILDKHAIEEVLKPFSDPDVQSVAGVVLAYNNRSNLLARITDLLFVTGQLIDRSMMSSFGSVLVNSGGLAAYRAEVIRDNLEAYLHETFFGRHIEFSDDSMLTLYALTRGKTVQQPTAFVFTMMPDKLSHHIRQQTRWMKGSFIRSWWRLKYLPITSVGFVRQAIGWSQFIMTSVLLFLLAVVHPIINHKMVPYILLVPIVLGYAQALRYFSVARSDVSIKSQLLTFALAPVAMLWSYFVLRPIRIYAIFTCFKAGWGTRQVVEVRLNEAPPLSFGQRLWSLSQYRIVFEGAYESALYAMHNADLHADDLEASWQAYYAGLSDRRKHKMWADFDQTMRRKIQNLETDSPKKFITLRQPRLLNRAI